MSSMNDLTMPDLQDPIPAGEVWAAEDIGIPEEPPEDISEVCTPIRPVQAEDVRLLTPAEVGQIWESDIHPVLERVIDPELTGFTLDHILDLLLADQVQCWHVGFDTYIVTELVQFALHRRVHVLYAAGENVLRWADAFDKAMLAYARAVRAKYIEIPVGRKEWEAVAKRTDNPWTEVGVRLRREAF